MGMEGGGGGPAGGISTPRVLATFCKVPRLMTAPTLIFIRAVGGFMSPFTNCTFEGLTSVPNTARETLDVTLEGDVLLQCNTDNPGAGGDLLEAGKVLVRDGENVAKGGKRQANPSVPSFHRQVVHVDRCDRRVRRGDLELMNVIDHDYRIGKDGVPIFEGGESDTDAPVRNKLDQCNPFKIQLFGQHLNDYICGHGSHHAISVNHIMPKKLPKNQKQLANLPKRA